MQYNQGLGYIKFCRHRHTSPGYNQTTAEKNIFVVFNSQIMTEIAENVLLTSPSGLHCAETPWSILSRSHVHAREVQNDADHTEPSGRHGCLGHVTRASSSWQCRSLSPTYHRSTSRPTWEQHSMLNGNSTQRREIL